MTRPGMHIRRVRRKIGGGISVINPFKPPASDKKAKGKIWRYLNNSRVGTHEIDFTIDTNDYKLIYKKWGRITIAPEKIHSYLENKTYYDLIPEWKERYLTEYIDIHRGFKKEGNSGVSYLLMRKRRKK